MLSGHCTKLATGPSHSHLSHISPVAQSLELGVLVFDDFLPPPPLPQTCGVWKFPRLGVESELQGLTCITVTATTDPSHICDCLL